MDIDIIGLIISIVAAVFVARQTYSHFIRNRAFAYIERFNHKDFMDIRIVVEQWLGANKGVSSLSKLLRSKNPDDIALSVNIRTYLNLFQELAVAFEKGMVDKHIFYRNFDYLIVSNWDKFSDYIYEIRVMNNDFTIYKRFEMMAKEVKMAKGMDEKEGKIYIFGYGSLMLPESIDKTLLRSNKEYHLTDAVLSNYSRQWDIVIKIFSDTLQQSVNVLFLNIHKNLNSSVDGMIFSVSQMELELIKKREVNYDCLEVTPYIKSSIGLTHKDVVVTFVGNEEHLLNQYRDTKVYVMQRYLDVLEKIKSFSPMQYEKISDSYYDAEVLEGTYTFNRTD